MQINNHKQLAFIQQNNPLTQDAVSFAQSNIIVNFKSVIQGRTTPKQLGDQTYFYVDYFVDRTNIAYPINNILFSFEQKYLTILQCSITHLYSSTEHLNLALHHS